MDQLLRGPGRFATKNVVLLAVLLLFASCAVGVSAQDPQKSTTKQETQVRGGQPVQQSVGWCLSCCCCGLSVANRQLLSQPLCAPNI